MVITEDERFWNEVASDELEFRFKEDF